MSALCYPTKKKNSYDTLLGNVDIFVWSYSDMTGIGPTLASHKLSVIATAKPVRQKIRHFLSDRHQIIQTEVNNLLSASFIREMKYPE